MENYHNKFYEQTVLWEKDYSELPGEEERIEQVIKIIPPDTRNILDVGCGNGFFVNTLINAFPDRFDRVVGLDPSKEALKYVGVESLNGDIANLPFEDESFDLVTSLEVLEHLPQEVFERGIRELQRVSKKNIIITVPNSQDLTNAQVVCPKCYCWFNSCFHMRSFDINILHNLFENFKLIEAKEIGHTIETRSYNRLLLTLYQSWKKPLPPETAICPQCGYQYVGELKKLKNNKRPTHSLLRILSLFKPLIRLTSTIKKNKQWLSALYEKAGR